MAERDRAPRYWIRLPGQQWREVDVAQWCAEEQRCGIRARTPGVPATGGFGSGDGTCGVIAEIPPPIGSVW